MARLPTALRARMEALGHTQKDVAAATGVPQPQISRALRGERKRLTPAMRRLSKYAEIESSALGGVDEDLHRLLAHVVSSGPLAEECVRGVLRSLVPLLSARAAQGSRDP